MGRLSRPFTVGGEKAFSFANTGVFTEQVVVKETQAVVIDPEVPFEAACLIGCAVVTGVAAVLNRAKVQPGQTVAVIKPAASASRPSRPPASPPPAASS